VALRTIRACAAWLRARGEEKLADELLEEMIGDDDEISR
jgi:hypothetical protein